MPYRFHALPTTPVRALQEGGADANGQPPERCRHDGDGEGIPCRHCLRNVPAGASYLIAAMRPFEGLNPYTETGPVFLCADPCDRAAPSDALPEILTSPDYILRGYDSGERIVYGTGAVTALADFPARIETLFADPRVAFMHVRSARNNCFQCRIERSGS